MELSLITKAQKEQKDILVRFYEKYNNVEMDFPDVSLTELFVKAAKVYPKKINRHSPYLSITLHKCYPYYLFGISTFPSSVYHSIALRKFSITIV